MWYTSRPDISSSCLPTPTRSALPEGAASAVLAPRPGGACSFRFFDLTSELTSLQQYLCKPRSHRREHREGSTWYLVCDAVSLLSH